MSNSVPESEIRITAARASGPGGQKVNKTNSKAVLHWSVGESMVFTGEQKGLIREAMSNSLNSNDEIVLAERQSRSWHLNRDRVIERLQEFIDKALHPKKKRLPTKPSRAVKKRRAEDKRRLSRKKQGRRDKPAQEDY